MTKWINIIALQVLAFTASSQIPFEELSFHSCFEQSAFEELRNKGSDADFLALYLAADPQTRQNDLVKTRNTLDSLILTKKLAKNPERLFYAVKYKYLRNFSDYPSFSSSIKKSSFNCVTGSALLAYMYSQSTTRYTIHELPHHTYLTVSKKNKRFLAESTSESFGFKRMTSTWEADYENDSLDTSPAFNTLSSYSAIPHNGYRVNNEITAIELAGLIYYNSAVVCINNGDYRQAIEKLEKAFYLYQSERIMTMLKFCLITELNKQDQKDEVYHQRCFEKFKAYQPIYHWIASMD